MLQLISLMHICDISQLALLQKLSQLRILMQLRYTRIQKWTLSDFTIFSYTLVFRHLTQKNRIRGVSPADDLSRKHVSAGSLDTLYQYKYSIIRIWLKTSVLTELSWYPLLNVSLYRLQVILTFLHQHPIPRAMCQPRLTIASMPMTSRLMWAFSSNALQISSDINTILSSHTFSCTQYIPLRQRNILIQSQNRNETLRSWSIIIHSPPWQQTLSQRFYTAAP